MARYLGGRIKKIKVRNFMTYDHVELYPKRGLNLIVGLNGSGKSSLMCAICLGLAGKPQFTGRSTQLSEFIKQGCEEAEIEIELESTRNNLLIRRKIFRRGDKSEWILNKSVSNQNEVANTVKQFNIDTSNLCQFLPQEKVVEFSRMDKKQRLENMLQAIGEPHLFELFNELKDLHKECNTVHLDVKKCQVKKNSAEEENERISDEVQKQESRARLRKELDELLKERKIVSYQAIREEVQQLRDKVKNQEMELSNIREEQKEANTSEDLIFDSYRKYSQQQQQFNLQRKDLVNKITTKSGVLASCIEQVENATIEYKNRLTEVDSQKKRLQDVTKQIEGLEKLLNDEVNKCKGFEEQDAANSSQLSQLQHDIHSLYKQTEAFSAEKNQIDYSIAYLHSQLSSLQNEHSKKMENLKKRDKYTYQASTWLLENKHRFKANIYLPVMLEIKVHSSENCKYVENAIGFRDMIAFVCEDKSDCERFTDFLAQQQLPVNVVMAPDSPMGNFVSPPLTSEYRNCGLQSYLSDLFTAPEPIMRYLCACYTIHRIPVATSAVPAQYIEFILQKYRIFFSENNKISGKRSKYGNKNWSVKKDFIMELNLLTIHNDEHQREVQQKLQALQEQKLLKVRRMEELESNLRDKEKSQEGLRQIKKKVQDSQKTIAKLKSNYQQKQKYREQISVVVDISEENAKVTRKISSINKNREATLVEVNKLFKEFINLEKEIIKVILCMNSSSKSLKLTRASNEEIHDRVKAVEVELENIMKVYREKKCTGRRLLQEIRAMGEISHMTSSAEDIEHRINHIQAQLNVDEDNELLVNDYNARKRKIEAFQSQIDILQCRIEELKEKMEQKKIEWLRPLQKHIANINKKFSRYFKQLTCAGEISLDVPENSDDFTKYGLQIRLKFHDDEPLTELSQTHHSGGECSVAAIVFILSLQELTEVPFRCIDEINQGMDSVNERKIFQLIADSVSDDRCSQYFLLTPKLLHDLEYPDDVAVHIIFNSCFLNIKLDVNKHMEIAQST